MKLQYVVDGTRTVEVEVNDVAVILEEPPNQRFVKVTSEGIIIDITDGRDIVRTISILHDDLLEGTDD